MTKIIEMSRPEDILSPELWPLAKAQSVSELRSELKEQTSQFQPVNPEDVKRVNPLARMELMQLNTRNLVALTAQAVMTPRLAVMMDIYDYLALDWVYSDELNWTESMAYVQSQKIVKELSLNA